MFSDEDGSGIFSATGAAGFGCHFFRSGVAVGPGAVGAGVGLMVAVVGCGSGFVGGMGSGAGFVSAGGVGLVSIGGMVMPLALRTPSRRSSATSLIAMSSEA